MIRLQDNNRGWSVLWSAWSSYPYFMPSIGLIVMGCILLRPGDTFAASPAWTGMAEIMGEDQWGLLMVAVGVVHLLLSQIRPLLGRWFLMAVWIPFGMLILTFSTNAKAPSIGVGIYSLVALLVLWSFTKWGARWPT